MGENELGEIKNKILDEDEEEQRDDVTDFERAEEEDGDEQLDEVKSLKES
jgi:hypothetical protein